MRPCLLTGVLEPRSDTVGVLIYHEMIFGSQVKPLTFRSRVLKEDLVFAESCIPNPVSESEFSVFGWYKSACEVFERMIFSPEVKDC